MRNAPFTLTAAVMLAVFLCFGNARVWACSECVCFSDATCSANNNCGPGFTENCARTEFTVDCDATYTLITKVTCTGGGSCTKCMACATLFYIENGTEVALTDWHNNGCNNGHCTSDSVYVGMSVSKTYVMYVCKVPCPDGGSVCGQNCVESCTAHACLSYGVVNCNP